MTRTVVSLHQGFQNTGASQHVDAAFQWLDRADANPLTREFKRRMLEQCPVGAGDRVLDAGCGLGHEALRLAQRVGPVGRVVGVDANPAMIAEARRRAAEGAQAIEFEVGDAHHLDFPDGTFDLCRTERVLRYLRSPSTALREMERVARPGGFVVAFDFDSDQTVVDAPDMGLSRRVAASLDAAVPNPWIGRQLFALFHTVGLVDISVVPHAVVLTGTHGYATYRQLNHGTIARAIDEGQITSDEGTAWWAGLEQAANTDTFFSVNLGFIVAGRKRRAPTR